MDPRYRKNFELSPAEWNHIDRIQSLVGNFIRTGNPNDWTGNPQPEVSLPKLESWRDSKLFTIFGQTEDYTSNYRSQYCDKLDEMDEYMMH
jgi:hypothetical protein